MLAHHLMMYRMSLQQAVRRQPNWETPQLWTRMMHLQNFTDT